MGGLILQHNLMKFADTGLQLRLPVDLVPATQYSRLTNCVPLIEGEIRTRDGLVFIEDVFADSVIATLGRVNNATNFATIANTIYDHGYIVGEVVTIIVLSNSPTSGTTITPGTYSVTVQTIPATNSFTFTPGILGAWASPADLTAAVFAQARGAGPITTLPDTAINTIFTLSQSLPTLTGDRLVSMAGRLFSAPLPAGTDFTELVLPSTSGEPPVVPNGFQGGPFSIISFRFSLAPESWAIIAAGGASMVKFRESGIATNPTLFFALGNPIPAVPATATADGAGFLDSSGGTDYDWRYTYFDGYVSTEGNPSPSPDAATVTTELSTSQITPDTTITSVSIPLTNSAFTGVTNTGGSGDVSITGGPSTIGIADASCIWTGFANPPVTPFTITASITWQATLTAPTIGNGSVSIQYSLNNGGSYTNIAGASVFAGATYNSGQLTSTASLPLGTDLTQVRIRVIISLFSSFGATGTKTGHIDVLNLQIDCAETPVSAAIPCVNQQALVCVTPPPMNDGRITGIRLYRRGGSLPDAWRLVGTFALSGLVQGGCGAGTLEITDNVSDTQLSSQPLLEFDNDAPVTSVSTLNQPLSFIWGPVGLEARVLGVGDPNRPESVYFSKPGNADAWPPENHIEVSDPGTPMIAGCTFNNVAYAFSRERIYQLVEGYVPGVTFTPFITPSAHGLFTPWGLAVGPVMFFISKDGIYATSGGQETSIVENDIKPLFPTYDTPGQDVNGYEAIDYSQPDAMRLRYHNDELYFLYIGMTTGTRQCLVYDLLKKRWRAVTYTVGMSEVYSEPNTTSSLLFGSSGGALYQAGNPFDPSELAVIENATVLSLNILGVTLTPGNYYVRVSRFDITGQVALSNEFSLFPVDATHGISVTIPHGPTGTTKWRVYYGTTLGVENQYQEFTEASLTLNRTVSITTAGTAGSPPTQNPDNRIAVNLRTGAFDQGQPLNRKQYDNMILDLDPGGSTITVTPLIDGEVQTEPTITVTGSGRQQVPLDLSDFFAFNVEYEISWRKDVIADITPAPQPILFQLDTLHYIEPVALKHWELQPSSFGFPGFIHMRDAYIAIRSTTDVTLTLLMDATTTQTYTIPSTGGERQRVYIQFASNKAKQYQLSLDSIAEFRTYDADLEIRVKPWLGLLGYSIQRPFAESGVTG